MDRADRRAYWVSRGYAEQFDKLDILLADHKARLQRVIDLAAAGGYTRVQQFMLDQLAKRAKSTLRQIEACANRPVFHPTHGDLGTWGRNGYAPMIDDICSDADHHSARGEPMTKVERDKDPKTGNERVAA